MESDVIDKTVDWGYGAEFGNLYVIFDVSPGWESIEFEDGSRIDISPAGQVFLYGTLYDEYKSALSTEVRPKEALARRLMDDGSERWVWLS